MAPKTHGAYALHTLGLVAVLFSGFWFTDAEAVCTPLGGVTSQLGLCKPQAGETGWTQAVNSNWDTIDANVGTIPTGTVSLYAGNSPPNGWYVCDCSAKSRTTDAGLYAIIGTSYGAGDGSTTFNLPCAGSRSPMFSGTGSFVSSTDFSNVNAGTDNIVVPTNNSLYTGTLITFSTTGSAPGGLTNGNPYYVVRVDPVTIQLATSQANAVAGSQINITTQGSGIHSFTVAYSTRNLADLGGEETHASTSAEMPSHRHSATFNAKTGAGSNQTDYGGDTSNQGGSSQTSAVAAAGGSSGHNIMSPFIAFTCMVKR